MQVTPNYAKVVEIINRQNATSAFRAMNPAPRPVSAPRPVVYLSQVSASKPKTPTAILAVTGASYTLRGDEAILVEGYRKLSYQRQRQVREIIIKKLIREGK